MLKFRLNNNSFVPTKLIPFFISKNSYLYIGFDIINFLTLIFYKRIIKKNVIDILKSIKSILKLV